MKPRIYKAPEEEIKKILVANSFLTGSRSIDVLVAVSKALQQTENNAKISEKDWDEIEAQNTDIEENTDTENTEDSTATSSRPQ